MSNTPRGDAAYCRMIALARTTPCLGWEAKVKSGEFGTTEFDAHKRCHEEYGKHLAYTECEQEIATLKADLAAANKELSEVMREFGWKELAEKAEKSRKTLENLLRETDEELERSINANDHLKADLADANAEREDYKRRERAIRRRAVWTEAQLSVANARVDAVSDALDYLKGLTPQQYADLRKDAKRLDWLARNYAYIMVNGVAGMYHATDPTGTGNLRAAIDAAIAAREP